MLIKLIHDARVNLKAGTEIEVTEQEGTRLKAFGHGEEVQPKKKARKK